MDPAGGLAQALARTARAALQQPDFARGRFRLRPDQAAAAVAVEVHAPLGAPARRIQAGGGPVLDQELGHVEADPAGADDRHPAAGLDASAEQVQVADHGRMPGAGEIGRARHDAGGQHDGVEAGQLRRLHPGIQAQLHPGLGDALVEVAQGLVELFLAGNALGQVELSADLRGRIEQGHHMPALGRHRGAGQPGRAGTDHGDPLRRGGRQVVQFGLGHRAGVDQATGPLVLEHMVQAGLVAGNAGVDRTRAAGAGLVRPLRVGQQRARQ